MSLPAIIMIILVSLTLSLNAIMHGQTTKRNFWISLVDTGLIVGLLHWGGFFS